MAIKGKKKTRGRPRVVASAPRPFLVPPKTPLMRRKSTQVVLLLILFGIIAGAAFGYRGVREDRELRAAVEDFSGRVETHLIANQVGQPVGGNVLVLPEMGQAIGQLLGGQGDASQIAKDVKRWERSAAKAADQIRLVETDVPELKEAREGMEQGLLVYAGIAADLGVALRLEGDARDELLQNLGEQLAVGAAIFDRGWSKLLVERHRAGFPDPNLGVEPGFPGGGGLPPGFPGGEGLPPGFPGVPGGG
jgi:hypothetical protein